ncbi:hypothetical protein HSRCO_1827 [Halanaeroarchaeum sp. HSR-CO]|nr:hypothetical protein HSRCO_1827 [Halanaeroarchaeum sp. HSR-CO]
MIGKGEFRYSHSRNPLLLTHARWDITRIAREGGSRNARDMRDAFGATLLLVNVSPSRPRGGFLRHF